jgi:hypothetical protein
MKNSKRLLIPLLLGGCAGSNGGGTCKLDGAAYVGLVALSRNDYPRQYGIPGEGDGPSFGGAAVFVPSDDAGALPQLLGCGSATKVGDCCYLGPPPDAGDDSSDSLVDLSAWTVTVADQSDPDAGSYFLEETFLPDSGFSPMGGGVVLGSLSDVPWIGGDELLVQGDGVGTVGTFSGRIRTPLDFKGLSPNVFSDAGAIPLSKDLTLGWTPGGASSITIQVLDETTSGNLLCTVPDNGSFTIPSAAFSNFQAGDEGGLIISRAAESCAYSQNASISLLVETRTLVPTPFQ